MDTDVRFTPPATRRTVVRTGAKLVYAAPIVAASFKVSAVNAFAVISTPSTCGPTCESQGDCHCATDDQTGTDVCVTTECFVSSHFGCAQGDPCPGGSFCVVDKELTICAVSCGAPCPTTCRPSEFPCFNGVDCCNGCCTGREGVEGICCS
jgi:hypothetical protein